MNCNLLLQVKQITFSGLLSEGTTGYLGSARGAMDFFAKQNYICPAHFNPAEFYIKTLSRSNSKTAICDAFSNSIEYELMEQEIAEEIVRYDFMTTSISSNKSSDSVNFMPDNVFMLTMFCKS